MTPNESNFENNVLDLLSVASTRSSWISVSSCASLCGIPYSLVWDYLAYDMIGQIAGFYRYEYRIKRRHRGFLKNGKSLGTTLFLSVVSRGYA